MIPAIPIGANSLQEPEAKAASVTVTVRRRPGPSGPSRRRQLASRSAPSGSTTSPVSPRTSPNSQECSAAIANIEGGLIPLQRRIWEHSLNPWCHERRGVDRSVAVLEGPQRDRFHKTFAQLTGPHRPPALPPLRPWATRCPTTMVLGRRPHSRESQGITARISPERRPHVMRSFTSMPRPIGAGDGAASHRPSPVDAHRPAAPPPVMSGRLCPTTQPQRRSRRADHTAGDQVRKRLSTPMVFTQEWATIDGPEAPPGTHHQQREHGAVGGGDTPR